MKYRKGYKYQLAETFTEQVAVRPQHPIKTQFVSLSIRGKLTIKSGYAWDGPSGPTFDTSTFMRGSAKHDALYGLLRAGLLPQRERREADWELYRTCVDAGMGKIRAIYTLGAVLLFAKFAASPEAARPVLVAP